MRDAQLLILDEPTAALDARSEFEVFQRFKELSEGKTAVLISHRFSSVRMADRILVLAEGEIEAVGHPRGAAGRSAGATPSCSSCRPPGIAEGVIPSEGAQAEGEESQSSRSRGPRSGTIAIPRLRAFGAPLGMTTGLTTSRRGNRRATAPRR